MQAQTPHQTLDREACHLGALLVHRVPDLVYAIDLLLACQTAWIEGDNSALRLDRGFSTKSLRT